MFCVVVVNFKGIEEVGAWSFEVPHDVQVADGHVWRLERRFWWVDVLVSLCKIVFFKVKVSTKRFFI